MRKYLHSPGIRHLKNNNFINRRTSSNHCRCLTTALFSNSTSLNLKTRSSDIISSSGTTTRVSRRFFSFDKDAIPDYVDAKKIRNVAIIAHVDHGKTTLVDEILRQSGMAGEWKPGARHLDSNDLERERGITILSKVTRIQAPNFDDFVFNIVDTPGHADFGGEVERVLSMVEGVVLLVDAAEGPKTQTRFVLQKALQIPTIRPLVVINKIDKPNRRAPGEVEDEIFDLFCSLDATEEQMDYPTLYASGKKGWCSYDYETACNNPPNNLNDLFSAIKDRVLAPESKTGTDFSMLVSQLDVLPHFGPTITGKCLTGVLKKGDKISSLSLETGEVLNNGKVKELTFVRGLKRERVDAVVAGDLVSVSVSGFVPRWTQTLIHQGCKNVEPILCTQLDPPVISISITSNTSPLAGRDGKYIALFDIGERIRKEAISNPAISLKEAADKSSITVCGRGELQLAILIEEMRREGFEMTLSPPTVVGRFDEDGTEWEPWERIDIEVPDDKSAPVIQQMATNYGDLKEMNNDPKANQTQMSFEISSRNFFGMRSWITAQTGGEAAVSSELLPMRIRNRDKEKATERNGVFVSNTTSDYINVCDYAKLAQRALGKLFIAVDTHLYMGMIMGLQNDGLVDIDTNICSTHDGYEKAKDCSFGAPLSIENSLTFIAEDECLEVTPKRLAMRKLILDTTERKVLQKYKKKALMQKG